MSADKKHAFLGQGWRFPPSFSSGVNPTRMISEEDDIKQSIYIIMFTRPGERVMRPDFGVDLNSLIFHNMNLTTRTQLKKAIEKAILYFEPRVTLTNVSFDMSEERNGILRIDLDYIIRLTNTRGNLVYPYYYEEHF